MRPVASQVLSTPSLERRREMTHRFDGFAARAKLAMPRQLVLGTLTFVIASCSAARSAPSRLAVAASEPAIVSAPPIEAMRPPPSLAHGVSAGEETLDFGLPRLDLATGELGELVWLSDLVGANAPAPKRVVLLSFFATWCEPCFTEMRLLNEWQERYGARGLQVLGMNYRAPVQDVANVIATTRAKAPAELQFPLLFERYTQRNQSAYLGDGEVVLPANVLIDGRGQVLARLHGASEEVLDQLRRIIESHVEGE